jgi:hypothetical protein
VLLTLLYRPLFTKLDAFKVGFLVTVRPNTTVLAFSQLTMAGRYRCHDSMGFLSDPHAHLELSQPCHRRSGPNQHSY